VPQHGILANHWHVLIGFFSQEIEGVALPLSEGGKLTINFWGD
jgi:hypothetical protein